MLAPADEFSIPALLSPDFFSHKIAPEFISGEMA